jgi:hypothetical protein
MTKEEKQLLLTDLCARLPHGVNLHIEFYDLQGDGKLTSRDIKLAPGNIAYCFDNSHWVSVKPYLRPMSSMTEEEKDELLNLRKEMNMHMHPWIDRILDFYLSHHLDWRGLILLELALEAPEDMYKTK